MVEILQMHEGKLFRKHGYCEVHKTDCPLFGTQHMAGSKKIQVHVAGTVCKDVSCQNQTRPGLAGPSGRTLLIWIFLRRFMLEDIIIQECTPGFPVTVLVSVRERERQLFPWMMCSGCVPWM